MPDQEEKAGPAMSRRGRSRSVRPSEASEVKDDQSTHRAIRRRSRASTCKGRADEGESVIPGDSETRHDQNQRRVVRSQSKANISNVEQAGDKTQVAHDSNQGRISGTLPAQSRRSQSRAKSVRCVPQQSLVSRAREQTQRRYESADALSYFKGLFVVIFCLSALFGIASLDTVFDTGRNVICGNDFIAPIVDLTTINCFSSNLHPALENLHKGLTDLHRPVTDLVPEVAYFREASQQIMKCIRQTTYERLATREAAIAEHMAYAKSLSDVSDLSEALISNTGNTIEEMHAFIHKIRMTYEEECNSPDRNAILEEAITYYLRYLHRSLGKLVKGVAEWNNSLEEARSHFQTVHDGHVRDRGIVKGRLHGYAASLEPKEQASNQKLLKMLLTRHNLNDHVAAVSMSKISSILVALQPKVRELLIVAQGGRLKLEPSSVDATLQAVEKTLLKIGETFVSAEGTLFRANRRNPWLYGLL